MSIVCPRVENAALVTRGGIDGELRERTASDFEECRRLVAQHVRGNIAFDDEAADAAVKNWVCVVRHLEGDGSVVHNVQIFD